VVEIARGHKHDMTGVIEKLLPPSRHRAKDAQAISLAVDGAIVRAQFEDDPATASKPLAYLVKSLATAEA